MTSGRYSQPQLPTKSVPFHKQTAILTVHTVKKTIPDDETLNNPTTYGTPKTVGIGKHLTVVSNSIPKIHKELLVLRTSLYHTGTL